MDWPSNMDSYSWLTLSSLCSPSICYCLWLSSHTHNCCLFHVGLYCSQTSSSPSSCISAIHSTAIYTHLSIAVHNHPDTICIDIASITTTIVLIFLHSLIPITLW